MRSRIFYYFSCSLRQFCLSFKDRINEIANEISSSTEDDASARLLAETLVADYGTHYTNRNGYGSMASVDIYLNASYRFEMLKNTTDLQANTRKFFKKFTHGGWHGLQDLESEF